MRFNSQCLCIPVGIGSPGESHLRLCAAADDNIEGSAPACALCSAPRLDSKHDFLYELESSILREVGP